MKKGYNLAFSKSAVFMLFLITSFLALIQPINVGGTEYYRIDLWNGTVGSSPLNVKVPPSFVESGISTVTLNPYANISGGTNIITNYKSPYDVTIATSEYSPSGSIACLDLGSPDVTTTTKGTNNVHEIEFDVSWTGSVNEFYAHYGYEVAVSGDYVTISNRIDDTENYVPFTYYHHECDTAPFNVPFHDLFNDNTYGKCKIAEEIDISKSSMGFSCFPGNSLLQYYFPFNTSSGEIEYNLYANSTNCQSPARWRIYPLDNSSDVSTLCNSNSCSGNISLPQQEIYVLAMYWDFCGGGGLTFYAPEINLTILVYEPDWECSSFSECVDNVQYQTCIDPLGKVPNEVRSRSCSITDVQNLSLGFERWYLDQAYFCEPNWIYGCGYDLNAPVTKFRELPEGWSVSEPFELDFVRMSDDWSPEGDRSLQMWVIPAGIGEPISTVTCGNLTSSRAPLISKGLNDSLTLSYNISFPTDNMRFSFQYKKCDEPVLAHGDYYFGLLGVDLFKTCSKKCYGNCTKEPRGDLAFDIWDTSTFTTIFEDEVGKFIVAENRPKEYGVYLDGLIEPSHNYTIFFAIYPESYYTGDIPYCVYIDDVKYAIVEAVPECESECLGNDWYKREQRDGTCFEFIVPRASECLDPDDAESQLACEPYCVGTTRLIPTEDCIENVYPDYEEIPNHPICLEEAEDEIDLFDPLVETEGDYAFVGNITSPFMILMAIVIFLSVFVAYKSEKWQMGLITAILIMLSLAYIFPQLAFIFALFIIGLGLIFGKFMADTIGGD